jgi:polar amino acid transport system substrate-binding protein
MMSPITTHAERFKIALGEFPPYVSEYYPAYGFVGKLVTRALALEGHSVEIQFYPWKRSYFLAQNGAVDATLPWAQTNERMQVFDYSMPILNGNIVLFFNKNKRKDWIQLDDLSTLTFGTITGYTVSKKLNSLIEKNAIETTETPNEISLFKTLGAGRTDVAAQDKNLGLAIIQSLEQSGFDVSQIEMDERVIDSVPSYLIAGKSNPKSLFLIEAFNRGLTKMIESGEYQKLLDDSNIQ